MDIMKDVREGIVKEPENEAFPIPILKKKARLAKIERILNRASLKSAKMLEEEKQRLIGEIEEWERRNMKHI